MRDINSKVTEKSCQSSVCLLCTGLTENFLSAEIFLLLPKQRVSVTPSQT